MSARERESRPRTGSVAAVISLCLAALASLLWLVVPAVTTETATAVISSSGGPVVTSIPTVRQTTLLNEEGRGIWIVLAIPVAVASLPTLFLGIRRVRWIRVVAAALLGVFVLLGAFSVGTFYLPSAVAMAIAASSR